MKWLGIGVLASAFALGGAAAAQDKPSCNAPIASSEGYRLTPTIGRGSDGVTISAGIPDSKFGDSGVRLSDAALASPGVSVVSFGFDYDPASNSLKSSALHLNYESLAKSDGTELKDQDLTTTLYFGGNASDGKMVYIGFLEAEFASGNYPAGLAEGALADRKSIMVRTCEKAAPSHCNLMAVAFNPGTAMAEALELVKQRHAAHEAGGCKGTFDFLEDDDDDWDY